MDLDLDLFDEAAKELPNTSDYKKLQDLESKKKDEMEDKITNGYDKKIASIKKELNDIDTKYKDNSKQFKLEKRAELNIKLAKIQAEKIKFQIEEPGKIEDWVKLMEAKLQFKLYQQKVNEKQAKDVFGAK